MENKFTITEVIPATPEQIYKAWLSTKGHGEMTGSPAEVDSKAKGEFTAWDGYISGETLEAKPYSRIIQAWRTTEFPKGSSDSRVEIMLEPVKGGTKITIIHSNIPEGQAEAYKQGWQDFYFTPMKKYRFPD
ncbi:MAG TPA: SRPBCC domain-containing protein [Anaerolineales bacterium]|nr:SRPBCC domain-containing protein [Anaerolineales bacterium]